MSAWDAGYAAGKEWVRDGGMLAEYDTAAVREQATQAVGDCPYLPLLSRHEMVTDWLYGFQAALAEEADDEA